MRGLIRNYTNAVTDDEWAIQAKTGGASPVARRAIGEIYRAYSTMSPAVSARPISTEFLQTLRVLASDRNRRTLQASESLPGILWFGLLMGGAIAIGMTFLLYMDATWPHIVASAMMAMLIGTLLFMILLLNKPFSGPLAIDSDSFAHAIVVYDSVDRGN
jgi:hypothetical protein